jgi:integrase
VGGCDDQPLGHASVATTQRYAAIATGDEMWAARVVAAFFTGGRPAELLGLRWQYVDLDAGTATLAWQLQSLPSEHGCQKWPCGRKRAIYCPQKRFRLPRGYKYELCEGSLAFVQTKTKTKRIVPLAAPLWAVLNQLAIESDDSTNPYDLVFHHSDGRPIQPKADYHAWKDLLANIKGLPANAVPYSSRHTTATSGGLC